MTEARFVVWANIEVKVDETSFMQDYDCLYMNLGEFKNPIDALMKLLDITPGQHRGGRLALVFEFEEHLKNLREMAEKSQVPDV